MSEIRDRVEYNDHSSAKSGFKGKLVRGEEWRSQSIGTEIPVFDPLVYYKNNSIKSVSAKTAYKLECNILDLANHYHESQLFFMTLTFGLNEPERIKRKRKTSPKKPRSKMDREAKAWDSLQTNILKKRGIEFIKVMERNEKGRKHFHAIIVLPWKTVGEVRPGVDQLTREPQKHVEKYYHGRLAELSGELSQKLTRYGFGRWNMTPVKSLEGLAKYLTKQVTSDRQHYRKGDRVYSCSKKLRAAKGSIAWVGERPKHFRHALQYLAFANGVDDLDGMRKVFGPQWFYLNSERVSRFASQLVEGDTRDIIEYIKPRLDHLKKNDGTTFVSPYLMAESLNNKKRWGIDLLV